jgi:hypothetical protein
MTPLEASNKESIVDPHAANAAHAAHYAHQVGCDPDDIVYYAGLAADLACEYW